MRFGRHGIGRSARSIMHALGSKGVFHGRNGDGAGGAKCAYVG